MMSILRETNNLDSLELLTLFFILYLLFLWVTKRSNILAQCIEWRLLLLPRHREGDSERPDRDRE